MLLADFELLRKWLAGSSEMDVWWIVLGLTGVIVLVAGALMLVNYVSYRIINRALCRRVSCDLNICCGKTGYGKVNADIVQHDTAIDNFVLVNDIYRLPFADKAFRFTLCAHTLEHVDDPEGFDRELRRVSRRVLYITPPLWDLAAQFNFLEHKWLVLSLKKAHTRPPFMIRNPLSWLYHRLFRQRIHA